jgi:hypothetical protein
MACLYRKLLTKFLFDFYLIVFKLNQFRLNTKNANLMERKTDKPKLVFFQWRHEGMPKFMQLHTQLHVKCLSEFFDVVLISKNCDYRQICDIYEPDLTLFESGYKSSISKKIIIKNTSAYPEIPKLGLHNGDAWCSCRVGFFSDMEHWGIQTFFSIGASCPEFTPEIVGNLFVWPNFIDSEIYHDYGENKVVPVLFSGNMIPLYPWRQKIYKIVSNIYPSLIFPHFGYENHSPQMIYGEQYARTINASWFVPSCGTIAKEVVRKHFEIPGCRSCLIAEKTPNLEAAGFIDMHNCVLADEKDILDKLYFLFQNKNKLLEIINAGYQMVQSQHTLKKRDQIFQWFTLYKNLKLNQKIVQTNPFKPLVVVEKSPTNRNVHTASSNLILMLLCKGDEKLYSGKYNEAEALFLQCLNYIPGMSEPKLKLAICSLYKGNVKQALKWVLEPIKINLGIYKAVDSDPVEWSYFIIALLCQGKLNKAIICARQFPALQHPELNRIRRIINFLANNLEYEKESPDQYIRPRYSIHQLPRITFVDWINQLCIMLKSCGQINYAEKLNQLALFEKFPEPQKKRKFIVSLRKYPLLIHINLLEKTNRIFEALHIPNLRPELPAISGVDYIIRLFRWAKVNVAKKFVQNYFSRLKELSNFLALFKTKNDDFSQAVQSIIQKEDINQLIIVDTSIITAAIKSRTTKKSFSQNGQLLRLPNNEDSEFTLLQRKYTKKYGLEFYQFESCSFESSVQELNEYIRKVLTENKTNFVDLILIENPKIDGWKLEEFEEARVVILNKINSLQNYKHKQKLVENPAYAMVDQNFVPNNSYAIFKKIGNGDRFGLNSHGSPKKLKPIYEK